VTCPNDRERPRRQEFSSRGSAREPRAGPVPHTCHTPRRQTANCGHSCRRQAHRHESSAPYPESVDTLNWDSDGSAPGARRRPGHVRARQARRPRHPGAGRLLGQGCRSWCRRGGPGAGASGRSERHPPGGERVACRPPGRGSRRWPCRLRRCRRHRIRRAPGWSVAGSRPAWRRPVRPSTAGGARRPVAGPGSGPAC
jgi:hypothetical protein